MMFIVGLGNPGEKYAHSRHNMGWRVVDALAKSLVPDSKFQLEKSLESEVQQTASAVMAKPVTYMNLSGKAVRAVLKKYEYAALAKKDFSDLFVIYDDLDLEVGKYKLIFGSGPKVHNGVNSVKETLGTDQFWHIRVGVDGRKGDRSIDAQDYVLLGFSEDEQYLLQKVIESIVDILSQKMIA